MDTRLLAAIGVCAATGPLLGAAFAGARAAPRAWGFIATALGVLLGVFGAAVAARHAPDRLVDGDALGLLCGAAAGACWASLGLRWSLGRGAPLSTTGRWLGALGGAVTTGVGLAGRITILDAGAVLLAASAAVLLADAGQPSQRLRSRTAALGIAAIMVTLAWLAFAPQVHPVAAIIVGAGSVVALGAAGAAFVRTDADGADDALTRTIAVAIPLALGVAAFTSVILHALITSPGDWQARLETIGLAAASGPILLGLTWFAWIGLTILIVVALDAAATGPARRIAGLGVAAIGLISLWIAVDRAAFG